MKGLRQVRRKHVGCVCERSRAASRASASWFSLGLEVASWIAARRARRWAESWSSPRWKVCGGQAGRGFVNLAAYPRRSPSGGADHRNTVQAGIAFNSPQPPTFQGSKNRHRVKDVPAPARGCRRGSKPVTERKGVKARSRRQLLGQRAGRLSNCGWCHANLPQHLRDLMHALVATVGILLGVVRRSATSGGAALCPAVRQMWALYRGQVR